MGDLSIKRASLPYSLKGKRWGLYLPFFVRSFFRGVFNGVDQACLSGVLFSDKPSLCSISVLYLKKDSSKQQSRRTDYFISICTMATYTIPVQALRSAPFALLVEMPEQGCKVRGEKATRYCVELRPTDGVIHYGESGTVCRYKTLNVSPGKHASCVFFCWFIRRLGYPPVGISAGWDIRRLGYRRRNRVLMVLDRIGPFRF